MRASPSRDLSKNTCASSNNQTKKVHGVAVVRMRLVLGNVQDSFDFTLADRSHLENVMILGRNFLTDIAVVDVGKQYVQPLPTP